MWIVTKNGKTVKTFFREGDAQKFAHLHEGCRADYYFM